MGYDNDGEGSGLWLFSSFIVALICVLQCCTGNEQENPSHSICQRVMKVRCVATHSRVRCALQSGDFSRLDLQWLETPVLEGDMICGPWRAP
jgi:hypothetical protein